MWTLVLLASALAGLVRCQDVTPLPYGDGVSRRVELGVGYGALALAALICVCGAGCTCLDALLTSRQRRQVRLGPPAAVPAAVHAHTSSLL